MIAHRCDLPWLAHSPLERGHGGAACSTSPQRGEVGARSARGGGGRLYRESLSPLTPPLSPAGRGSRPRTRQVRAPASVKHALAGRMRCLAGFMAALVL